MDMKKFNNGGSMSGIDDIIDGEEHNDFLGKLHHMKLRQSFDGTFTKGPTEEYFDNVLMKEHERRMFEAKLDDMSDDELVKMMSVDIEDVQNYL